MHTLSSSQQGADKGSDQKMMPPTRALRLCWIVLVVLALSAQGFHIWKCANSPIFYFPNVFTDSDMFTTRIWAQSILEQGWTNPAPYHPQTSWMVDVGSRTEWEAWWGGGQIFQQSPLYAYLMAAFLAFSNDLIYLHMFQGLCAVLLFILIGRIAAHITQNQWAGPVAFAIAAVYAPFYAYSWEILRDLLCWLITAGLIVLLCEITAAMKAPGRRAFGLALGIGFLLGIGLLTREFYALLIPLVWGVTFWIFRRHGKSRAWLAVVLGTIIALVPLMIRNATVGAPLLSTSNRFAEAFIQGNASSAHPYFFIIPPQTRAILDETGGKSWPLVKATLATHPSVFSWVAHQGSKFLSLMDPFESYDNVSMSFMGRFSPLVKWGLRHWMIITPGLIGLSISLFRRDTRNWPLWIVLPTFIAAIAVALPLSRYRQAMAVLWIPWVVYFAFAVARHAQRREWRSVAALGLLLVAGWGLSLGPLSRVPPGLNDRPLEYALSVGLYRKLNLPDEAERMREILRQKFPTSKAARAEN